MLQQSWLQALRGASKAQTALIRARKALSSAALSGSSPVPPRMSRGLLTGVLAATLLLAAPAWAGTFGQVVSIGGAASDVALDEARGVLYVANFTANRIEVVSTASGIVQTSMNVASQPSSLSLSPDGRWLVVTHYGEFEEGSPRNGVTLIDLSNNNARQTFTLATPPLGVAFGINNKALIVTTTDLISFDPAIGTTTLIRTIEEQAVESIPQPAQTFPPNIVQASVAASADGGFIWGIADSLIFRYNVSNGAVISTLYSASPTMGPRSVSVSADGSFASMGWWMVQANGSGTELHIRSEFAEPLGNLERGSHAVDSVRNLVYSEVPSDLDDDPLLTVRDASNLMMREQIQLPEHLAGPSVLSSDGGTMYASSDSGVLILPIGHMNQAPRLHVSTEDLVFYGNFCERGVASQTFTVSDPGGAHVPFAIFSDQPGVRVSPSSGVTPAVITVDVDPNSFAGVNGTVEVTLTITSDMAVNLPEPVRVLVNSREPDQRGTFVSVPGTLVDLVANPDKDEYYVLRQDKNMVYVFDGSNHTMKTSLPTCTMPMGMAVTFNRNFLLVGCDASELITVIDLQTLRLSTPIHGINARVQSIASSAAGTFVVARHSGGDPTNIQRVNMATRKLSPLSRIGVWENEVPDDTVAVAAPNGNSILFASADGSVILYDANVDDFTVSRKDFESFEGAYAASSFNTYVIGNRIFNSSLVATAMISPTNGSPSGFSFLGKDGFFITAPGSGSNGVLQRVNGSTGESVLPTRTAEAPRTGTDEKAFTRTLARMASGQSIVALTVSGITVFPPAYDASVAPPQILRAVSAADGVSTPAPGGLFTVYGNNLAATNIATNEIPLPTALAGSCLTVNGFPVPMIFVSDQQANAQMLFQAEGATTLVMHTPGGVSDNYNLTVNTNAPAVFAAEVAGPGTAFPTVVRNENNLMVTNSNPIHREDILVIYLTGMGAVTPAVENGTPSPMSPLATTTVEPVVTIGGHPQDVLFSGLVPGQVGLYQINIRVPFGTPTGLSQQLSITQGTATHSVPVRVVE